MSKQYRFSVEFSQDWIFAQRNDDILPVDRLLAELKKKFTVPKTADGVYDCGGMIELTEDITPEELNNKIAGVVRGLFGLSPDEDVFRVSVTAAEPEQKQQIKQAEEAPDEEDSDVDEEDEEIFVTGEDIAPSAKKSSVAKEIRRLIGADEFKQLAEETVLVADELRKKEMTDIFLERVYLISINDGCGLTTYLHLFCRLAMELKLMPQGRSGGFGDPGPRWDNCGEVVFAAPGVKEGKKGAILISDIDDLNTYKEDAFCFDISEWMSDLSDKEFRKFLRKVRDTAGKKMVFFRVPFVEKNTLRDIKLALNDQLFIRDVSIPPFSRKELLSFAQKLLSDRDYTATDGAWEVFEERISQETADGRFYGIDTLNKLVSEMLYLKLLYNVQHNVADRNITKKQLEGFTDIMATSEITGLNELRQLVGMEKIADRITEVIAQIEIAASNKNVERPCIHMRFVGSPGTGKTTVARLIGKILKEKGLLRMGGFIECTSKDLVGKYVGHTAPKTAAVCRDAYGSVLFIDEAYALFPKGAEDSRNFGKEAIDTLITEMENHRDDLVVIMAGYSDEMEHLMNSNPGLRSRMPYMIEFPNFSRDQLAKIFFGMAEKAFVFDDDFRNAVNDHFLALPDSTVNAKEFSNARYVRNLYERVVGKAALRCQLAGEECKELKVADLALAVSEKDFEAVMEKRKAVIGF